MSKKKKKSNAGRKSLPDDVKRNRYLAVSVTKAEADTIRGAADAAGEKQTKWMRDRLLDAAKKGK